MRSNKEQTWDNLMTWDKEFQIKSENMENMETTNAAPPGIAAQNLVGSVDYMYFMGRHAYAVSNNPISRDASATPHLHKSFLSQCSYILWAIASLMTRMSSNLANQGNPSKYWSHAYQSGMIPLNSNSSLSNSTHGYFEIPYALSSFKI
jgi:hypothetical protein